MFNVTATSAQSTSTAPSIWFPYHLPFTSAENASQYLASELVCSWVNKVHKVKGVENSEPYASEDKIDEAFKQKYITMRVKGTGVPN